MTDTTQFDGRTIPVSPIAVSSFPAVVEHACYLIFPVPVGEQLLSTRLTLGDLADTHALPEAGNKATAAARWLAAEALTTISDERRPRPVWEPGSLEPGDDLYPHVQRLLGGEKSGVPEVLPTAQSVPSQKSHTSVWRLSESGRKLVQGQRLAYPPETPKEDRLPRRLCIRLSKSARTRIAARVPGFDADVLGVAILDMHLIALRTGHAFVVAEMEVAAPGGDGLDPYLIVEALHALSRINETTWRSAEGGSLDQVPVFDLGAIVRGLTGQSGGAKRADRVFSATYVQFAEAPDPAALDRLLTQLARHYTDDYDIRDDLPGTKTVSHFRNVQHRFALEGCVTAVDLEGLGPEAVPIFLKNYRQVTYRRHYLPIVLLAYHELCFLLHATNDSSFWPEPGDEARNLQRMQAIRERVTGFTLCFRFSYVSRIGMHNDVNRALREVLGLDWMLAELDRDSAQIDAYLSQAAARKAAEHARRQDRRFRWASVIGIFGLSWLTTFTIAKEILELRPVHDWLHLSQDLAPLAATAIGLVIAVVAAAVTAMTGRHPHGLAEHAQHETVIHAAHQ